jgi:DNA-binding Lrp family transcriptional regulator
MSPKRPETLLIERAKQFDALRSELRLRILGALQSKEPSSVNDLAEELGREAEPLYYHVNLLHRAGLIRETGIRQVGRREEVLYERASDRIQFHPERKSPAFVQHLRKSYSHGFRLMDKTLAAATGSPGEIRTGEGKNVRMQSYNARLSPSQLDELNARLDHVREFLKSCANSDEGTAHQILLAMSPVKEG